MPNSATYMLMFVFLLLFFLILKISCHFYFAYYFLFCTFWLFLHIKKYIFLLYITICFKLFIIFCVPTNFLRVPILFLKQFIFISNFLFIFFLLLMTLKQIRKCLFYFFTIFFFNFCMIAKWETFLHKTKWFENKLPYTTYSTLKKTSIIEFS